MLAATLGVLLAIASGRFESRAMLGASRGLVIGFGLLVTLACAALVSALLSNSFEIAYVSHYSERASPIGYTLAAFWAGQEGSLLLWAWLLAIASAVFVIRNCRRADRESAATLATIFAVLGFFAALMLFAANPFVTNEEIPRDGHGLNPMLQDP